MIGDPGQQNVIVLVLPQPKNTVLAIRAGLTEVGTMATAIGMTPMQLPRAGLEEAGGEAILRQQATRQMHGAS